MDRAGDEVRSWFGDEEAERRRRFDERERERERRQERAYAPVSDYDRGRDWSERGYASPAGRGLGAERWGGERWTGDYGRADYGRTGAAGYRGETGYGMGYGAYGERYSRPYGRSEGTWDISRRSDFTGRGPKGYHRSDARITEDVCDRLADAPDLDASNIEVKVNNGEVMLTGTVSHRDDKRRAEDLIENLSGVGEVHNQLRVSRWEESAAGSAKSGTTTETTRR